MRKPMPRVEVKFDSFALKGGVDLHTPQLSLPPGVARDSLNFECSINGGYSRIEGYERFDGRPSPSAASYATIAATAVTGLAVGDSINGQTSSATGVVAYIDGLTVVYTKSTGTFVQGENLREGVGVVGVITTVGVSVTDQTTIALYTLSAANIYRTDITAVPGSGGVLGVFTFGGVLYAFRNNAGATAAVLHKSTGAGWVAVTMPSEVAFTAGSGTAPLEGAIITKGAVTAVVRRVMVKSGTFLAGTAAGRLIVDTVLGGSFSAGAFTAGITATCSGAQTAVVFLPGGRFEFKIGNAGNGVRVYGADGINRGFEFDGNYVCPITTGNTSDNPLHVHVHLKYLWFSFLSSAQYSGVGAPYQWTILAGAGEIAVNQNITGFLTLPGSESSAALAILTVDGVSILYGTSDPTTWNLPELNAGVGSKAYSQQALGRGYIYDNLGIVSLDAVQAYGNFATNTLTVNLRSFVQNRRTLITESLINREKSQYRVFFSDGYALYLTMVNGKYIGSMPVKFTDAVSVACNGDASNGGEVSYFGSTNGMVYRMDIGTSFDGGVIDWVLELAYANQRNSQVDKTYRRAVFEIQGNGYAEFNVGYTLAYGDPYREQGSVGVGVVISVSPAYWDSFVWDAFIWDGRSIAPLTIPLDGTAENISLRVSGSSAYWASHTINSVTMHYTPRNVVRAG